MDRNAKRLICLTLALAAGTAWAKEGAVVKNGNGTWGCADEKGQPIPGGHDGQWEGKPIVDTPCRPATLPIAAEGRTNIGTAGAARAPKVATETRALGASTGGAAAASYARTSADGTNGMPLFDAKGLVPENAGKSISEKGVSSTKSR